jgi:hypothetical protein
LDPSGGYRHWGAATAIGRGADAVRRNLYDQLLAAPAHPGNADEALRLALNATMASFETDGPPSPTIAPHEHYAALVLAANDEDGTVTEPLVGIVDPHHVQSIVHELRASRNAVRAS